MKNKGSNRYIKRFLLVLLILVVLVILMIHFQIINIDKIIELGNDFQYNIISMSSIIGGFLFTGLSLIISVLDNERIDRLWENGYLNNLYRVAIVGLIFDIISLISALAILISNISNYIHIAIYIEMLSVIISIIFFAWNIGHLLYIIKHLKK